MIDRPGIFLAHKPIGVTSFSVVRAAMEELAARGARLPVCHGGTLDPFAEGLLLLLVGQATRLMDLHHGLPKTYVADVTWGAETDAGDALGKVVLRGDASALTPEGLEAALAAFVGWTEQVPPPTSAKKVGGEPAYKKVHRGEAVSLPACSVYLHQARWLSHHLPTSSRLSLTARGGFYVRSLARDLGRALGCGAHLSHLRRTAIGPWPDPGAGARGELTRERLLPWCSSRQLDDNERGRLKRGEALERGTLQRGLWSLPEGFPLPDTPVRAFHLGKLVALLDEDEAGGVLRPRLLLHGGL